MVQMVKEKMRSAIVDLRPKVPKDVKSFREGLNGHGDLSEQECTSLTLVQADQDIEISNFDALKRLKDHLLDTVIFFNTNIVIKIKDDKIKYHVTMVKFKDTRNGAAPGTITIVDYDGRNEVVPFHITARTVISIESNDSGGHVSFADVIGLDPQIETLKQLVSQLIKINSVPGDQLDAPGDGTPKSSVMAKRFLPTGVLVHGFNGTGKSLAARALVNHCQDKLFIQLIDCNSIIASTNDKIVKKLKSIFDLVKLYKPSVIIFDHLDKLFVSKKASTTTDKEIAAVFEYWFDSVIKNDNSALIIGITNNLDTVDTLRWPGKFEREIEFTVPLAKDRRQLLFHLIDTFTKSNSIKFDKNVDQDAINEIADSAFGYTGADLLSVVSNATLDVSYRNARQLTADDIKVSIQSKRPSAMREMKLECQPIKWSSIGGVDAIKAEIDQIVIWPIKEPYCSYYNAMKLSKSTGILLYGPPGCSKTMIGQAIATESKLNFLSIRGPELFSKYVGDSEKAVRDLFSKARSAAPSMIFIDEIDALAPERGSSTGNSGVGDRMVNTLLIEMDGIQSLKDVVVIGATNRPQVIDPALKRPGRFDREIYVPLPDLNARAEIFKINLDGRRCDHSVDVNKLASLTDGFSGAEIAGIVKRAALKAIEEHVRDGGVSNGFCGGDIGDKLSGLKLNDGKEMVNGDCIKLVIKMDHFTEALKIKPRTSKELIDTFEEYYKNLNH